MSLKLITSDYYPSVYNSSSLEIEDMNFVAPPNLNEDIYFSTKWGVGFKDGTNKEGDKVVIIAYVDVNSPFNQLQDIYTLGQSISITSGQELSYALLDNEVTVLGRNGAQLVAFKFEIGRAHV